VKRETKGFIGLSRRKRVLNEWPAEPASAGPSEDEFTFEKALIKLRFFCNFVGFNTI
jgi:hypothetical protein